MRLRRMLAIWAARFAGFACKKMGRQGVTWAGKIALKLDPNILKTLAGQVRKGIFVTCGTNGKTTTNRRHTECNGSREMTRSWSLPRE